MILIYSQLPLDKEKIDKTIEILKNKLSLFFIDIDNIIYSTESNQKLLRELAIKHQIKLVYIHSIINHIFWKMSKK